MGSFVLYGYYKSIYDIVALWALSDHEIMYISLGV
jgi:hypothetical protein